MVHYTCDMCGAKIERSSLRYIVKTEVFAGYDTLIITKEDLERDHSKEIEELIRKMGEMDPKKLADDVYVSFKFDLCKKCKEIYTRDPLNLPES